MTRWSAHRLPRVRRDMADTFLRAADDPDSMLALAKRTSGARWTEDDATELRNEARQMLAANLFWVTRDMTRLALQSSGGLPEWTPAQARPATYGLLVWEDALPHLAWRGAPDVAWRTSSLGARVPPPVAVHGVAWAPHPRGVRLNLLTKSMDLMDEWLMARWRAIELFPFGSIELPVDQPVPTTSDDWSSGLVAALGATWLMMAQPTVASRTTLDQQAGAVGVGRPPRPDRDVTIIDLRRLRQPTAERDPDSGSSRVYTRRWMVSGHWRQQACGPGRAHRKPVFVPPHVKGPDGAPMIDTEYVHVWRR